MKSESGNRPEQGGQQGTRGQSQEQHPYKQGDRYRCDICGTEVEVSKECNTASDEAAGLQCCGQPLNKVDRAPLARS